MKGENRGSERSTCVHVHVHVGREGRRGRKVDRELQCIYICSSKSACLNIIVNTLQYHSKHCFSNEEFHERHHHTTRAVSEV